MVVVSVLAFYLENPSSNPDEVYNFSVKLLLKRTKINKKAVGLAHFFQKTGFHFEMSLLLDFNKAVTTFLTSVTRLGDFLHFGQQFKASGNKYFTQIAHIVMQFL